MAAEWLGLLLDSRRTLPHVTCLEKIVLYLSKCQQVWLAAALWHLFDILHVSIKELCGMRHYLFALLNSSGWLAASVVSQ